MGTLYIVATPIGNLADITHRAIRVLQEVELIAAEDTRHSGKLLAHFKINTPMISYHSFNERSRIDRLLAALSIGNVALISDAGTPAISDPGSILVAAAAEAGHLITPVPGPSALTSAVSSSGLIDGPFTFLGFLPRAKNERRDLLSRAASTGFGIVIYEAPARVGVTLAELAQLLDDRNATVARELTKLHEEIQRGTLSTLAVRYAAEPPRGEIVIVIEKSHRSTASQEDPEEILTRLLSTGMKLTDAAKDAALLTNRPRSELYEIARKISANLKANRGPVQ